MQETIHHFFAWLTDTIFVMGYPGIALLMAIESSLIPLPSELVMPPAGYLISQGQMSWIPAIFAGTFGSLFGAYFNYAFSLLVGRPFLEKFGKYFFLPRRQNLVFPKISATGSQSKELINLFKGTNSEEFCIKKHLKKPF